MNWLTDVDPSPGLLVLPPGAVSLDEAHAAIEQWEFYSRKTLDPPQRLAVEIMLAESESGRWAARTTGREMPRQNGKGDEIEVVEFWGLTQRGEAILHTAHELNTVSSAHQRMVALLSHRDFSGKRKPHVLNGLGQQSIRMGDAVVQYRTRTAGGGRGLDDISRLVVDEAQHARPEQLASATPTLLANPNPQMNFAGTGGIEGVSDWWWRQRIRALGDSPGDFGYLGHTAERVFLRDGKVVQEPVDPLDRSLWPGANPALVYNRTDVEFLEEQLRILGPALFAREHLGVWDPPPLDGGSRVIPADDWNACAKAGVEISGRPAFAIDVAPYGTSAAVAISDGSVVEVVAHRAGTDWIVDACLARKAAFVELVVPVDGAAKGIIPDLKAAGLTVREVQSGDHAQACIGLLAAVKERRLRYEPSNVYAADLSSAAANADRREVGDGAWLWSRTRSSVDISPLVACTLAAWAAGLGDGPVILEGSLMA